MIHNGDCLEIMKSIPDKSVDLIICDLPYGEISCKWDTPIDLELFWKEIKRIRKNDHTPTIHFCSTRFGVNLINSNSKEFRYDLVWNKKRGVSFLTANKRPMVSHELIYVFSKKGANYNRIDVEGIPYFKKSKGNTCEQYDIKRVEGDNKGTRCVLSVIDQFNTAGHNGKQHPTAKPVDLYKWLIERYSNEGDVVLDPTFGSGNSGLVCKSLNRNYIGIEKEVEYFEKFKSVLNEEHPP